MRKTMKVIGVLLILVGLFGVAGIVATHAHAASPQGVNRPAADCLGALVTSADGTQCLPPGTRGQELSGVTRICNTYHYPVNFLGNDTGPHVIHPGTCQTFAAEDGTIYVDE